MTDNMNCSPKCYYRLNNYFLVNKIYFIVLVEDESIIVSIKPYFFLNKNYNIFL